VCVVASRSYEGDALDGTVQYIGEAPHWQGDGETVDVVDDEPIGTETTEGVPVLDDPEVEPPDAEGQTTFEDWGWSA
jgi:hypothetical protein